MDRMRVDVGDKVCGEVCWISDYNIGVTLADDVTGVVPAREASWDEQIQRDLYSHFHIGKRVQCVATHLTDGSSDDDQPVRVRLSIRRLDVDNDPWRHIEDYARVDDAAELVIRDMNRDGTRVYGALIQNGRRTQIDATVSLVELESYLAATTRPNVEPPSLGDHLIGDVVEVDVDRRMVQVDVLGYLRRLDNGEVTPWQTLDSIRSNPSRASVHPDMMPKEREDDRDAAPLLETPLDIKRILIADDDPDFLHEHTALAREMGLDVATATNASEIVSTIAADSEFDLLLVDVNIPPPPAGGVGALLRLIGQTGEARIVLHSGQELPFPVLAKVKDLQISGMIRKPYFLEELIGDIRKYGRVVHNRWDPVGEFVQSGSQTPPRIGAVTVSDSWREDMSERLHGALRNVAATLSETNDNDTRVVLFSCEGSNRDLNLVADSEGLAPELEKSVRRLRHSVVFRAIATGMPFAVDNAWGKELQLRTMWEATGTFSSCFLLPFGLPSSALLEQESAPVFCLAAWCTSGSLGDDRYRIECVMRSASQTIALQVLADLYLRQMERAARVQMLGELSTFLGHELSTRIGTANASLQRLRVALNRADRSDTEDVFASLESHMKGIQSIANTVRHIGGVQKRTTCHLWAVVNEVIENMLTPHAKHMEDLVGDGWPKRTDAINYRFENHIPRDFPLLYTNRVLLEQILVNLGTNAINHGWIFGRPTQTVQIAVEPRSGRRGVVLLLRDTGPGIHAKYWHSIYGLGYSTTPGGLGFGLTVCDRFARRLGGSIALRRSCLYAGTEFSVELPSAILKSEEES